METTDNGEHSALDMRITKAGVEKIPLAKLDKLGCKEWNGCQEEKGSNGEIRE